MSPDSTDLLEPDQRLVEDVVLHDPQLPVVGPAASSIRCGAGQVVAHRLLQVDVPPVTEQLDDPVDVKRDREQRLDGIDFEPAGRHVRHRGERPSPRPVGLALGPTLLVGIDQGHHLDIGIVHIGPHVEVVDASEAHERGPHRTVIGNETHCRPFLSIRSTIDARRVLPLEA